MKKHFAHSVQTRSDDYSTRRDERCVRNFCVFRFLSRREINCRRRRQIVVHVNR